MEFPNLPTSLSEMNIYKVIYVLIMIFIFSIVYTFFDNSEFAGWIELSNNHLFDTDDYKVKRHIFVKHAQKYKDFMDKDEFALVPIFKIKNKLHVFASDNGEKVDKEMREVLFNLYSKNNGMTFDAFSEIPLVYDLYKIEKDAESKLVTFSNKYTVVDYFDRLYYSAIVQTTIGFGDVFPASRMLRFWTMVQALSTVFIMII